MLIAPFCIRKFGKKKILIFTNLLNIGFIILMLPIVRMTGTSAIIWLLLLCIFVNQFISALSWILTPSVNADIRDYQQYISGERIDGMFAAVGLIGSVITLVTSGVLPAIQEKAGLNAEIATALGYNASNVYDVLYDKGYFIQISSVLIIASVVGAVMNVIPYFFYDLTETKQKAMISVLKIRALFEDYGNGVLSDEALVEAVDIIKEAEKYDNREIVQLSKNDIKQARKTKDKIILKAAKDRYKKAKEDNEKIEIAHLVMNELHRFETAEGAAQIDMAQRIVNAGLNGFMNEQMITKAQAKAMPKNTQEEKDRRRDAFMQISKIKTAKKAIKKYFPNGIEEFDNSVFEALFKGEDENELELHNALKQMRAAKENNNNADIQKQKAKIKELQQKKTKIKKEIKAATDKNSIYYRAAKPYLDAEKILKQMENYQHYDEIIALYDDAKSRINELT